MRVHFTIVISILLFFTAIFSSCNDKPEEPNYPIKISFEEYSLEGTQCQWTNLPCNDKVIVINSNEELGKYITCAEGSYPVIDFAKHSLLLASGIQSSGILELNVADLQQHSSNKYSLSIDITLSDTTFNNKWHCALIVNKLGDDCKVRLSNTFKNLEIIYPIDISFEKYSLIGTKCEWNRINFNHKVPVINNNEELEKFISCNGETYPEIDFSKYTLILAHGVATSSVDVNCYSLQQISKQNYEMRVYLITTQSPAITYWKGPVIVKKISDESIIELIIEKF